MPESCRTKDLRKLVEWIEAQKRKSVPTVREAAEHLQRSIGYVRSIAADEGVSEIVILQTGSRVGDWGLIKRESWEHEDK